MASMYRVRAVSQGWLGGPGLNTFYFGSGDATGDAGDAQLCADRVHAAFDDAKGAFPSPWKLDVSPTVDVLNDVDGELTGSHSVTPPAQIIGTGAAAFNATAVMLLAQLRTGTFDDGSRIAGRAFLGPVSRFGDDDGTPDAGLITKVVDFGAALMDAGPGGAPALKVWRRPRKASEGPPEVTQRDGMSANVLSITCPNKYAILRSRRD